VVVVVVEDSLELVGDLPAAVVAVVLSALYGLHPLEAVKRERGLGQYEIVVTAALNYRHLKISVASQGCFRPAVAAIKQLNSPGLLVISSIALWQLKS